MHIYIYLKSHVLLQAVFLSKENGSTAQLQARDLFRLVLGYELLLKTLPWLWTVEQQ